MDAKLTGKQKRFIRKHRSIMSAREMAKILGLSRGEVLGVMGRFEPEALRRTKSLFGIIIAAVAIVPLIYARFYYSPLFVLELKLYFVQAIGLSCLCVSLWRRGKLYFAKSPLNFPILVFIGVAVISAIFSVDKEISFRSLISMAAFALVYCLASTEVRENRQVRTLTFAVATVAAAVSLYSLLQLVGVDPLNLKVKGSGRAAATFMNTNFLGAYLSAGLAIVLPGMAFLKTDRSRYAVLVMVALTGAGLACSGSRAGWVGLIAALVFFAAIKCAPRASFAPSKRMRPILMAILVIVAITTSINYFTSDSFVSRFASMANLGSRSVEHRFIMWKTSLDAVRARPVLGFGLGTFQRVYPRYQAPHLKGTEFYGLSKGAHNDYLETATSCGLLGLACILWILATAYIFGIRRVRSGSDGAPVVLTGLCCVTAVSVIAVFHNAIFTPTTGLLFWLSLGLINYSSDGRESISECKGTLPRKIFSAMLALIFGYIILVSFFSKYYFGRGSHYLFKKNYKEALFYFEKSTRYNSRNPLAHANIAVIQKRRGKYRMSLEEFEAAIRIDPDNPKIHHGLGTVYEAMNRSGDAIRQYEKALSLNPNSVETYNRLAMIYSARGQHERAIGCYKKALKIDVGDHGLLNGLGVAYARAGRYQEAIACLKRAIAVKPSEASYRQNLAKALADSGEHVHAVREYRRALEMSPDETEIMIALGTEYARSGDLERAREMYQSALDRDPKSEKARRSLAIVSFHAGYYDESSRVE